MNPPFTKAPLNRSHAAGPQHFPGYPYAFQHPASGPPRPTNPIQANGDGSGAGEGVEAWQAAQSILRAIDFGSLLRMPAEGAEAGTMHPGESSQRPAEGRLELQGQLALLAAQLAEIAATEES
jgi:hypothetical protein